MHQDSEYNVRSFNTFFIVIPKFLAKRGPHLIMGYKMQSSIALQTIFKVPSNEKLISKFLGNVQCCFDNSYKVLKETQW